MYGKDVGWSGFRGMEDTNTPQSKTTNGDSPVRFQRSSNEGTGASGRVVAEDRRVPTSSRSSGRRCCCYCRYHRSPPQAATLTAPSPLPTPHTDRPDVRWSEFDQAAGAAAAGAAGVRSTQSSTIDRTLAIATARGRAVMSSCLLLSPLSVMKRS